MKKRIIYILLFLISIPLGYKSWQLIAQQYIYRNLQTPRIETICNYATHAVIYINQSKLVNWKCYIKTYLDWWHVIKKYETDAIKDYITVEINPNFE